MRNDFGSRIEKILREEIEQDQPNQKEEIKERILGLKMNQLARTLIKLARQRETLDVLFPPPSEPPKETDRPRRLKGLAPY
jgi:hypothetical protein